MPRTCTICMHPDREKIDQALLAGEPLRDIARRTATTKDALARHKSDHLPATMVKAAEHEDVRHAIDIVKQLKAINGASLEVLQEARASGNGELALKAIDRIQRQIELQAKLIGELQQEGTVNITIAPQWLVIRSAILMALQDHPDARTAVVTALGRVNADAAA